MTTSTVRRLYFYVATFIGLQLLIAGARMLLTMVVESVFLTASVSGTDQQISQLSTSVAMLVVGLGLWIMHWLVIERGQGRDEEQRSTLRRLYLYAILLISALSLLFNARSILRNVLQIGSLSFDGYSLALAVGTLVVQAAVFSYHTRIAAANRSTVEAHGGTATLRRWYLVIVSAFGLGMAAYSAVDVLTQLLRLFDSAALGENSGVRSAVASMIAGLVLWVPHHIWGQRLLRETSPLQASEARSTLRQVYGGFVIVVSAVVALGALVIFVEEALLALLGSGSWSAVFGDHRQAVATVLVSIPVWLFHRSNLANEARATGTTASVETARRIVAYLMAAVGLATLFFGLGGLLSTLLRYGLQSAVLADDWRNPLAFSLALSVVALPVYGLSARETERLAHSSPMEERTLARRIYLYAALLFGIITTIVAVVQLVRLGLEATFGLTDAQMVADIGRWIGYAVIGIVIGYYHLTLVRRAGSVREETGILTVAVVVDEPLSTAITTMVRRELPNVELKVVAPAELTGIKETLQGVDVLVTTLSVLFERAEAGALHRFGGTKILLPTTIATYEVLGAERGDDAFARETVRVLRVHAARKPIAPTVTTQEAPVAPTLDAASAG